MCVAKYFFLLKRNFRGCPVSEFDYKMYSNSPATHWMMGVFNSHATGRELTLSKDIKLGERVSERMNQVKYSYESRDCIGELIIQEFHLLTLLSVVLHLQMVGDIMLLIVAGILLTL